MPGVGKEQQYPGQAGRRQHVLQHLDSIVAHNPDVVELCFVDFGQQVAYTGAVDLDAKKIDIRLLASDFDQGFAVTKADFQPDRRVVPKNGGRVDAGVVIGDSVDWKQCFPGLISVLRSSGHCE